MTIESGQNIPSAQFQIKSDEGIDAFSTDDYFKDSRVVMFAVPGAFTPTCSVKHVPGYIKHADALKQAGIDKIACLSVNDAHVMHAWGEASQADGIIDMIADMDGSFSRALGIEVNMGAILGKRATRCAIIVDNGLVTHVLMEEPGEFSVSSAENVLATLGA
ncbi:peroxiredoxin [Candidatus Puniceispirillum sp.]|jgi:glutaredoxin/glutathione-dependent peroxiredoxin|uniref:peroxiredoxin n=1 Tax=Candidatus Puniceispirillum sp. TaxID=2026719 RepID=UPI001ED777F0|nr:peroxiredoxin [Candidatus Puniceispirillum sp.]MBT6565406.1 peroxiredoxin [Candidatus Puniceispirillum sp.]